MNDREFRDLIVTIRRALLMIVAELDKWLDRHA